MNRINGLIFRHLCEVGTGVWCDRYQLTNSRQSKEKQTNSSTSLNDIYISASHEQLPVIGYTYCEAVNGVGRQDKALVGHCVG